MPSGPPELHEKWGSDHNAVSFLKGRGYRLLRTYEWVLPEGRDEPTDEERSAMSYLFLEWDFSPGWMTHAEAYKKFSDRMAA